MPFDSVMAAEHYGGQLAYFLPLRVFFNGEDMDFDNTMSVCTTAPFNVHYSDSTVPLSGAVPVISYGNNQLLDEVVNNTITATGYMYSGVPDDTVVEVFALIYTKGANHGRVLGWFRNRNNWWFNLPHAMTGTVNPDPEYPCYNPKLEVLPLIPSEIVLPVYDVTITIPGVCNGSYRIDFYSVYPNWPLDNTIAVYDGGIIGSIFVESTCNTLTFSVPGALVVLQKDNGPCAPDYGFKAIPLVKLWGYGYLGVRPSTSGVYPLQVGLQPFSVGRDGLLVAYADPFSGNLMIYERSTTDDYVWQQTNLVGVDPACTTPITDCVVAVGGHNEQIYYKGIDGMLHCAFQVGGVWAHGILNNGSGNRNINGDIGCCANGGKVFFRNALGGLHMQLWQNHLGVFQWWGSDFTFTSPSTQRPAEDTNFSVSEDGSLVVYRGLDGFIYLLTEVTPANYQCSKISSELATGMVRINYAGDSVFYLAAADNSLKYLRPLGVGWIDGAVTTSAGVLKVYGAFDISPAFGLDNAQVYFQGADGFIHVAYAAPGQWIEGHILCPPEPADRKCRPTTLIGGSAYIRYNNGAVIYQGTVDGGWNYENFRAYYYGKGDATDS